MKTCECGQEINKYRIFAAYIPIFHIDQSDEAQVAKDGPLLFRYGGIFKPQAYIECPECGKIYLYSIRAKILEDMERQDNKDLWEAADRFRKELEKKEG